MSYQDPAPDDGAGVTTVAKEQAGQVGHTAAQAGGQVAQTTKEQAQNVVGEAKQQARDLVGEARTQVRDQAGTQKGRAVEGLRTLGDELRGMAFQGGQSGIATEVARQAADRAHGLAEYLDRHEPADLLEQVRSYARRRPAMFLAGAAVAGVLAGRLTRNLASSDDSPRRLTGSGYQPSYSGPGYADTGYTRTGYDQTGYADTGYAQTGYAESGYPASTPSIAVPPTPAYPGGGVETVGYEQPGTGYDQPATGYDQPGTGYEQPATGYEQPGAGYEPGTQYPPDGEPRDWRAP